jgi:secondary thiamine-phosphate synthase enzyme
MEAGWKVLSRQLEVQTQGRDQIIDVTESLKTLLSESRVQAGLATVFTPGATASVTTVEYEPGLVEDIKILLEELIPWKRDWEHNRTWGDGNGGSHLRAALIGPSLTVPVVQGELTLGTWQQIVVIDHDTRPRSRKVVLQVMGTQHAV